MVLTDGKWPVARPSARQQMETGLQMANSISELGRNTCRGLVCLLLRPDLCPARNPVGPGGDKSRCCCWMFIFLF